MSRLVKKNTRGGSRKRSSLPRLRRSLVEQKKSTLPHWSPQQIIPKSLHYHWSSDQIELCVVGGWSSARIAAGRIAGRRIAGWRIAGWLIAGWRIAEWQTVRSEHHCRNKSQQPSKTPSVPGLPKNNRDDGNEFGAVSFFKRIAIKIALEGTQRMAFSWAGKFTCPPPTPPAAPCTLNTLFG